MAINVDVSTASATVATTVTRSTVVQAPVDSTLSIAGQAADAKATGDALSGVVKSVNGKTPASGGVVSVDSSDIPYGSTSVKAQLDSIAEDLTGSVPATRKVNGKALSSDISLNANDVGAASASTTVNGHALNANIDITASDVGAPPKTRKVNGKPLTDDITLTASDVGAVPTGRTICGIAMTGDVELDPADVGVCVNLASSVAVNGTWDLVNGITQMVLGTPYGDIHLRIPSDGGERTGGGFFGTWMYKVRITRTGNTCKLAECSRRTFNWDTAAFGSASNTSLSYVYGTKA